MEQKLYKLPKGWNWCTLGDVAHTTSGGTPRRTESAYWGGDIPWIKSGELGDSLIKTNQEYITDIGLKNSSAKIFPTGSLLIALYGATAGKLGVLTYDAATNQAVCCITPLNKIFFRDFLRYYLFHKRKNIVEDSFGGAQPNISQTYIRNIRLPLPPFDKQKRIVTKLNALFIRIDRAINYLQDNLKLSKDLFASVLDEIFTSKQSKWELKPLNVVATVARGKSKHRPRNDKSLFGGDYPFIQTGNVRKATKFITSYTATYNAKGLDQSKLWPEGTICLTIAANIGDVAILGIDACFPDSVVGITSNSESNDYIYYFLTTLKQHLDSKANAVAQKNINLRVLSKIEIPVPPLTEQHRIVAYLDKLAKRTHALEAATEEKLHDLAALKSSLLDNAFRGQL